MKILKRRELNKWDERRELDAMLLAWLGTMSTWSRVEVESYKTAIT